jgi:hypothetical protein
MLPAAWDLCGVGTVPLPHDAALKVAKALATAAANPDAEEVDLGPLLGLPAHMTDAAAAAALERTRAVMRRGSARAQAAALLLERTLESGEIEKRFAAFPQMDELAQSSGDPVVARWSAVFCYAAADKNCEGRVRHWIRVDPDNGAAWAMLWALTEKSPQEALAGIAASRRYATYWGAVFAEMLNAVPADVPAYLRYQMAQQGYGAEGMLSAMSSYQRFTKACITKPNGAEVPVQCQHLAELMVSGESSLVERKIAVRVGESLGWPAERLQAARQLIEEAARPVGGTQSAGSKQPFSCETVEPALEVLSSMATKGEVQAWLDHPAVAARIRAAASAAGR